MKPKTRELQGKDSVKEKILSEMERNMNKELDEITVNGKDLGSILGVSDRMVRDLAEKGTVIRSARGRYSLIDSVKRYILNLKVQQSSRSGKEGAEDDKFIDLDTERAKHERLKSQITEIKLQLIQGKVHRSEDVDRVLSDMFEKFRSKLTSIPPTMARKLEGMDRTQIQKLLQDSINRALEELAAYNPEDYYSEEYIRQDELFGEEGKGMDGKEKTEKKKKGS